MSNYGVVKKAATGGTKDARMALARVSKAALVDFLFVTVARDSKKTVDLVDVDDVAGALNGVLSARGDRPVKSTIRETEPVWVEDGGFYRPGNIVATGPQGFLVSYEAARDAKELTSKNFLAQGIKPRNSGDRRHIPVRGRK